MKTNSAIQFFDLDSYKVSHHLQLPKNTSRAFAYIESRGGGDAVKFFGLQHILKQFRVPTHEEVDQVADWCEQHFGSNDIFNRAGWHSIVELGYYPLEIKAVKEGSVIPVKNVLATVENTIDGFAWLVTWFETQLLRIWYPTNVASKSLEIKLVIEEFLERNGTPETLEFKLWDFGSRGATTPEAAGIGGLAHLLNFKGSDTLQAIPVAFDSYNASEMPMVSIAASEHSVMSSWTKENEIDAFRNMIEEFGGPGKIYACVSDTYDIWAALEKWKSLEQEIVAKGGTLVVRPDSGDPVDVPVKVVQRLIELFGSTVNEKGYQVLPDYIRVIQGDGVDVNSITEILRKLDKLGISSDNITFGMGGALLQKHDRDTFKFAYKVSSVTVDGEERDVYKDPVTDPGKSSKRGILELNSNMETVRREDLIGDSLLQTVWKDGQFVKEWKFEQLR